MIQFLKKLSAALLITLLIGVMSAMASGKMEVKIGERVDLVAESTQASPTYKWVVKKGDEILSTQSTRNFNYQFIQQGEYTVNLTATSGSVVESATIHVLAGDRYSRPVTEEGGEGEIIVPGVTPLKLRLETLPPKDAENQITLLGDSGKIQFLMSESTGEILEYRIDKNIFIDSDGNGTANDDIDNAGDDSYLTGGAWSAEYQQNESSKIAAEVTLVDKNGKKVKQQVAILFKEHRVTGDPVAAWEILPSPGEDGNVHLYEDSHTVSFYPRVSEGKILEYRIDKNIFTDSDGDGNPSNDIDNLNDISFKTGDVFEVQYNKTDEQIIAQLIVVGEGGKGSRIQKGFVFGEKPQPPAPVFDETGPSGIRLTADKVFVVKGDPITFTVTGLTQALDHYTFAWDFDGNGEMDKETEGVNTVDYIYDFPGVPLASVTVTDQEGNTADYALEILVKDAEVTKADFTFETEGNTVRFTNLSTVSEKLANKTLDYQWSFGETDPDSYEEQKSQIWEENPVYHYPRAGTYLVTLTVTDADQVTDSKSAEAEILQNADGIVGEGETEKEALDGEESPLFVKLLKFALYLILIVVGLVLLIVGGALVFFKIQQPDLTFEELVDELKAKILTRMGVHEMEGIPSSEMPSQPPSEPVHEEPMEEETPAEPAEPIGEAEGKTPPWMQNKEVIEGEVEESAEEPEDDDETPPSEPPAPPAGGGGKPSEPPTGETDAPASEKGPVPDWLKGV
ncbi:PKD domain-containing protein [Candidatus Peregrinibacteria bacterium]|nr:PKD domain-containing protein [Candidatus Peregrinibacteria bacterium]